MLHEEVTHKVIAAAMNVHTILKPGLDEKLYERALIIELGIMGLQVDQQREYPVTYKGHDIGTLIPDLIVEEKVVVDTKVATAFNDAHMAQMLGYLAITGLRVGLLLNFSKATLEWKRMVR